jgi:hypothetical protein
MYTESHDGAIFTGKPKNSEKTFPNATLSRTNLTCNDPGAKPCLRGERLAIYRLNHGTDLDYVKLGQVRLS